MSYLGVGILLLVTVWGTSFWIVTVEGKQQREQARLDVERAARGYADHVTLILEYADVYLKMARDIFAEWGVAAVARHLESAPIDRAIVSYLTIIDETGRPLLASGFKIKPGTTAKDRGYFKFQQTNPVDSVYLSLPKVGQNSGKLTVRLVRRMTGPDGRFAGVIFAAIDVGQILRYFDTLNLGARSAATIVGMDGKVRAYTGPRADFAHSGSELDYGGSILWDLLEQSPVGIFENVDPIDSIARLSAYSRLSEYPLAVVVGVSKASISNAAGVYRRPVFVAASVISVLIVFLMVLASRESRTSQQLREVKVGLEDQIASRTDSLRMEIDERKFIETALKASEVRLKDYVDTSSDWFWEMDKDCRFSYFSDRFAEITGVPQKVLLGKTREETGIPGVDPEIWRKHLDDLSAHRSFRDFPHPRVMPDGREVHLSINGKAIFDEEGRFQGYRGTGSDVTERKKAMLEAERANQELERRVEERTEELQQLNRQLGREEAKLREILENSPVGVAITTHSNDDTRIAGDRLFVNTALVRMFRETGHESFLKARIDDSWVDLDQLAAVEEKFKNGEDLVDFEVQRRRMDGTTWWVSMNTRPIRFDDQDCTMVWHFDVTERRNAEESLRQAQKMEAVGQLTGGVAHDFNNLLAVIQGNAELMEVDREYAPSLAESIMRAVARGSELTQRLLAFSRQQPLHPRTVDLAELVSGMTGLLTRTLGETIEIERRADPNLWAATADPGQVENALLNLAINARDAMPRGGRLTIECLNASHDEAYAARTPDALAGDYVMLAVTDTGHGMTDQVKAHAFEPFFTTKEVGEGSGLGLSMIYGFAKQSGGYVSIDSEENLGTTVKLYLPRAKSAPAVEDERRDERPPMGRGETILVVEDDSDVRALAITMLRKLGYQTIDVSEVAAAREVLATGGRIDLVLSDVVLPGGVSGLELAEELCATHAGLPVILMSGYSAEVARREVRLGQDRVLLNKPFQLVQLAQALREALD